MTMLECPSCHVPLLREEVKGGNCPSCQSPLAVLKEETTVPEVREALFAPQHHRCDFCGKEAPEVDLCFLRPNRHWHGPGKHHASWFNVQCHACEECYRAGETVGLIRLLAIAAIVLIPLLGVGAIWLLDMCLQTAHVPDGVRLVVVLATGAVLLLAWVVVPVVLVALARRRRQTWLRPVLDDALRTALGIDEWGWLAHVRIARTVPENEGAVPLPWVHH